MKKSFLPLLLLFTLSLTAQQNTWNVSWKLEQLPFLAPQTGSELAIVKAGFDTDQDGWGEFLCAWTDLGDNYLLMYEATGDNQFDLVWYYKYPPNANTFAGIAVGDADNNGIVDIITTMPMVVSPETPNPERLWNFEWSGVQGENKYGRYTDTVMTPTNSWNFDVPDNTDFRPYSLQIEDIDNDGKNELVAGVRQGGRGREVVVASVSGELSGFGFWEVEYNFAQSFGGSLYSVTTGDLDGDGLNEIYALIWNMFTMRIFEYDGAGNWNITTEIDELYSSQGIDYGAVDGVRVADVNGDGVNELYIAATEPQNQIFIITGITDVSQITGADVQPLLTIPGVNVSKLRAMYMADPDHDGNMSMMIAGEGNGKIFDVEYKGSGDPADSTSWEVNTIFDVWDYSGIAPDATPTITPRFFYGYPAGDMDQDGKDEYCFINYSTDFSIWANDVYLWVIEIDAVSDVENELIGNPNDFALAQNYPNPFNPATKIKYRVPAEEFVSLKVFDLLGKEVASLVEDVKSAGTYEVSFNAAELSTGVYFYKLTAGSFTETKKMMVVK